MKTPIYLPNYKNNTKCLCICVNLYISIYFIQWWYFISRLLVHDSSHVFIMNTYVMSVYIVLVYKQRLRFYRSRIWTLTSILIIYFYFSVYLIVESCWIEVLCYVFCISLLDTYKLKMVFSYTPKSDAFFVDHKLVVLVSVLNGLVAENLLKKEVYNNTIR